VAADAPVADPDALHCGRPGRQRRATRGWSKPISAAICGLDFSVDRTGFNAQDKASALEEDRQGLGMSRKRSPSNQFGKAVPPSENNDKVCVPSEGEGFFL
jgi:hypothetical protein